MTVATQDANSLRKVVVGESAETQRLRVLITQLAPSSHSVWIEGETGVGKECVAEAMHIASGRRGPFVPVNVCAISESMFEDAFFGHVSGSFTGALGDTIGFFGEADEGTLFLDEISGLPLAAQAKLLRAVELRRYRPVGATADRTSRFRVLAASNEPMAALVHERRLRSDLAFRLRGGVLKLTPLRDRPDDIDALAEHFLNDSGARGIKGIEAEALVWLRAQRWPGNARELRQLLQCAVAFSDSDCVGVGHLRRAQEMLGVDDVVEAANGASNERGRLLALLQACAGSTQSVADRLSVDRSTVYRMMHRVGIHPTELRSMSSRRPSETSLQADQGRSLDAGAS